MRSSACCLFCYYVRYHCRASCLIRVMRQSLRRSVRNGLENPVNPPHGVHAPMPRLVFATNHSLCEPPCAPWLCFKPFLSCFGSRSALHHAAAVVVCLLHQCQCVLRSAACFRAVSADQADCLVSVGALAAPLQELLRRQRGPCVPGVSCAICFASIVRASKN